MQLVSIEFELSAACCSWSTNAKISWWTVTRIWTGHKSVLNVLFPHRDTTTSCTLSSYLTCLFSKVTPDYAGSFYRSPKALLAIAGRRFFCPSCHPPDSVKTLKDKGIIISMHYMSLNGAFTPVGISSIIWMSLMHKSICVCGWMYSAIASGSFERVCVLFNIAAMQSQIAETQNIGSDDGRKTAAKLFQVLLLQFILNSFPCLELLCNILYIAYVELVERSPCCCGSVPCIFLETLCKFSLWKMFAWLKYWSDY